MPGVTAGLFFGYKVMVTDNQKDWHLEKGVSLSHILTTVSMLLLVAAGYMSFSERLAVMENQQKTANERIIEILASQRLTDVRQDHERSEIRALIREDLQEINRKLDAVIKGS